MIFLGKILYMSWKIKVCNIIIVFLYQNSLLLFYLYTFKCNAYPKTKTQKLKNIIPFLIPSIPERISKFMFQKSLFKSIQ